MRRATFAVALVAVFLAAAVTHARQGAAVGSDRMTDAFKALEFRNLGPTIGAGARRAVVLRAIAEAEDPERAARALRHLLDAHPLES